MGAILSYSVFPKWLSERGQLLDYSSRLRTLWWGLYSRILFFPSNCQKEVSYQTTAPGWELCDGGYIIVFYFSQVTVRKRSAIRLQLQVENFVCDGAIQAYSIFPKWLSERGQTTAPSWELCLWWGLYSRILLSPSDCQKGRPSDYCSRQRALSVMGAT